MCLSYHQVLTIVSVPGLVARGADPSAIGETTLNHSLIFDMPFIMFDWPGLTGSVLSTCLLSA